MRDVLHKEYSNYVRQAQEDPYIWSLLDDILESVEIVEILGDMRKYNSALYLHSFQVYQTMCLVERNFTSDSDKLYDMAVAALLHDCGKLKMPNSILNKPDSLSNKEWEIMHRHPIESYNILRTISVSEDVRIGALQHHEKLDGSGYPNKLLGYDIESFSRVLVCCDIYSALCSSRPYKNAILNETAVNIMMEMRGLDANVINVMLRRIKGGYCNPAV